MKVYKLTGRNLSINDISFISRSKASDIKLEIDKTSLKEMHVSRKRIIDILKDEKPVYGINTGFGAMASVHIPNKDLEELQYNLIRSHCTGMGRPFNREITRAIMVIRANCLIQGYSGVTPEIIELLLEFINHDILPVVPEKGSVGASGDLAPLSHIALALIGEGDVVYQGKTLSSHLVMDQLNLTPAKLGAKDGLALINGTAVMAALGVLAVTRAEDLARSADVIASISTDALRGTVNAYDERITQLKPHPGQLDVVKNINCLLKGSEILTSHPDCGKVQDPYSLRCIPQVHGACRQTMKHCREVLEIEINSVTDNPLVFENGDVVSGGNFHGEAIAMAMDYLCLGLAELCNISERRVEKLMNPSFSDLPAFLIKDSGLNSGLMIAHVTMAALTSENKILCHPASVDSIPTSTDKEDHVSMGVTSGRKLYEVLDNLSTCLAIELLCNTQGLEFLRPLKSSPALEKVVKLVRKHVPPIEKDRVFHHDMTKLKDLIIRDEILAATEIEII